MLIPKISLSLSLSLCSHSMNSILDLNRIEEIIALWFSMLHWHLRNDLIWFESSSDLRQSFHIELILFLIRRNCVVWFEIQSNDEWKLSNENKITSHQCTIKWNEKLQWSWINQYISIGFWMQQNHRLREIFESIFRLAIRFIILISFEREFNRKMVRW